MKAIHSSQTGGSDTLNLLLLQTWERSSLYARHYTQPQIRLIVAQSMSRPVSFSRRSSFHSVAESEPFLSTWSKCQHFYDSHFFPSCTNTRGETLQLLLYTTAQTTYSLPHWHYSSLCCLSAVCFSAEWILTEVLHLFMLTNHVWVIAHPQWSSKPSRRCQVCQTPFHLLLRKSSGGDVEYLESSKENFEYFLFFFFLYSEAHLC